MPPGLVCLHEPEPHPGGNNQDILVDIIAVHGVGEDSETAWTHSGTGVNWLQHLLPKHVRTARVLAYGYDATTSTFFGKGSDLRLQMIAESFIQELVRTDRYWKPGKHRRNPIIFICHGLGGLLVKKCLFISSTQTTQKGKDLYNLFVSTYAILFFGTPHTSTRKSNWLALEALSRDDVPSTVASSDPTTDPDDDVYRFEAITSEFSSLIKVFRLFCYWEQLETSFEQSSKFVVDSSSAIMELDEVQRAGIHANHSDMVKFGSLKSSGLRMVLGALAACCHESPRHIANRWRDALPRIREFGVLEAGEIGRQLLDASLGHSTLDQHHGSAQGRALKHFGLPDDPRQDFIGREQVLNVMYNAFFPYGVHNPSLERKSYVIYGMGGCGKTQLCVRFAQIYRDHYAAVFTICAASEESIKDSFRQIGEGAGLERTESAGRHVLSNITEPWLLIVDNADDRSVKLRDIFPSSETAHILITTRNPDYAEYGTLGSTELKGLDQDEALQLLLSEAKITAPWDASTKTTGNAITKALGYLAIALIQAGSQIKKRVCTLGEYLSLHSTKRATFQYTKLKLHDEDDPVLTIYKTFDISMIRLLSVQSTGSQDALELLRIVSYYHFDHIPVDIFTRAVINRKGTNSPGTSSFVWTMMRHASTHFQYSSQLPNFLQRNSSDHWEIKSALHTLAELSLIRYDDNQAFTFGIHPLLHEWARDTIPLSERKIWSVMALNTLMESLVIPGDDTNEEFDNSEFHSSILVHLEACLAVHGDPFKSLWKYLQPISLALNRVKVRNSAKCGLVLAERGFFTRATAYLQPVTEALMQGLGSSNETTEAAILGLSQVYWGLGRLDEAIKYQSQVVEVRSNSYGPEHKQTLQAMNLLGRSFWLHGMYGEALVIQRLLQDRMKSTVSLNDPLALSSKDNLGVTLGSWHQFEQSRKIHEEVLACRRELLGTTHPSTLETMSNLAMALLDLGKNIEALALMIKVFDHRQAKFGREHPWTLWAHCYLAKVKIEMGLLQEAEKMLVWGIAAGERSLDKRHLGVLMGRGQLARVYAKQGRFDEAESLTLEIIALLEPSRGIAHPDCVYALYKLGMLYDRKQDYPRAIESYGLALERADLRLTREHPLALKVEARRQRDLERLKAASEPSREERNRSTSPSLPIPEHLDQSQLKSFRHQQTW